MNAIFVNVSKSIQEDNFCRSHHAWVVKPEKKDDFQILVEVAKGVIIGEPRAILNGLVVEASPFDNWEGERVNFRSKPLEEVYSPEMIKTITRKVNEAFVTPTNYVVKQAYGI